MDADFKQIADLIERKAKTSYEERCRIEGDTPRWDAEKEPLQHCWRLYVFHMAFACPATSPTSN